MSEGELAGEECASLVMEVVPVVMRFLRGEMRRQVGLRLSVPQFRTLAYVHRHCGATYQRLRSTWGSPCRPCPGWLTGWSNVG